MARSHRSLDGRSPGGRCPDQAQFGTNDLDGSWIIEGHGVDPDIVVENTHKSVIEGRDLQLERAIEEITGMMERDPKRFPPRPAPPVKNKTAETASGGGSR